jgi:phosphonate utilization transcriptional regulator PhnR
VQYVKIKEAIAEQINSGLLLSRQRLPAERKLADSFSTTRATLREALYLLEAEGKVYREDRRGWFISPQPLVYDPTQTLNFTEMALAQQREPKTQLITADTLLANKQAAKLLELPPFTDIYQVDRVRYLEDRPVVFVTNYIKPKFFPNLLDLDLSQSLTNIYREYYNQRYSRIRFRVSTTSLLGNMAKALRATVGSPATLVERINYNQNGELIDIGDMMLCISNLLLKYHWININK